MLKDCCVLVKAFDQIRQFESKKNNNILKNCDAQ